MRQRDGGRRRADERAAGAALIYGWHSALAALQNPRRGIRRVVATRNALARLKDLGIRNLPEPAEPREIDRLAGDGALHQGILVVADMLPEQGIDDLEEAKLLVVLDQVTDPHNVGAVLRSAAAFGADALIMTERHSPTESGVLAKAASGALEHVNIVHAKNLARALDQLGEIGFFRIGLDSEYEAPIDAARRDERIALVLGAEGKGLRRLTREKCDALGRLDLPGPIKSLNVSNAAALALYVVTRRG